MSAALWVGSTVVGTAAEPAASAPSQWPMYNGRWDGQRYSALTQITSENVGKLAEVCRVRVGELGAFHTGPVLVQGKLVLTTARATLALDPHDCGVIWKTLYVPQQREPWMTNRGVGIWGNLAIRGTTDARVVAYDLETGQQRWITQVGDSNTGAWVAGAPLTWNGVAFVGLSGGDFGMHGRVMALDANTGALRWQFNTVPQEGESGSETWKGRTFETGGGGTWSTFALDPAANEVFVPVDNPAPDFDGDYRRGANLYTDSLVVLDAQTGKLKWYYQVRANDDHDYGIAAAPVLYTAADGRKLVAVASKDGYVYVIDRSTHRLLFKQALTTLRNHDAQLTSAETEICPGLLGGVEWNGPALDPVEQVLLAGATDWCSLITKKPAQGYVPGEYFVHGDFKMTGTPDGSVTALDALSGKVKWRYPVGAPVVSAITPTAGGVTFVGDALGHLLALRTRDGQMLNRIDTGGAIAGGIITYEEKGRQFLAVTSGNVSRAALGAVGVPTLVLYALPVTEGAPSTDADPSHGREIFAHTCSGCHGQSGEGALGPALRGIGDRASLAQTVQWIRVPKSARMPTLYPDALSAQDVLDVASYIRTFH